METIATIGSFESYLLRFDVDQNILHELKVIGIALRGCQSRQRNSTEMRTNSFQFWIFSLRFGPISCSCSDLYS